MVELAAPVRTPFHEIWKHYQSTTKARAQVQQDLIVPLQKYHLAARLSG